MKYMFLVSIAVLGFSSCKKDYTCSCKDANGTPNNISLHGTKKKAVKDCNYYSKVYEGTGIVCSLE